LRAIPSSRDSALTGSPDAIRSITASLYSRLKRR
jgi:hypothetical protein